MYGNQPNLTAWYLPLGINVGLGLPNFQRAGLSPSLGLSVFFFFLHMFQMERKLEPAHGHISFIDGPLFCRFSFSINKKHSVFCAFALRHSWLFELRKAPKPCKQGLYRHGKKKVYS